MIELFRQGVLVKPYERLSRDQLEWLDQASLDILSDPGVWCYSERAARLFKEHGAKVREEDSSGAKCWRVSFPGGLIKEAVAKAPSRLVANRKIACFSTLKFPGFILEQDRKPIYGSKPNWKILSVKKTAPSKQKCLAMKRSEAARPY
ncbi:MAG: trimethylamine methyltransferase family protein [Deltaproteobacteria bacterium]|nr:trimethylamine methyltransferase family protein [Deltaproteobacteria bacterium]